MDLYGFKKLLFGFLFVIKTKISEELQRTNRAIQELTQQDIKDFLPIIECIHFVNALQSNNAAMGQLRDMIINVAERAEAAPAG